MPQRLSPTLFPSRHRPPLDRPLELIRAVIFDSLGVSQGGELTQEHALHLWAAMNPGAKAVIAPQLQQYDPAREETVTKRISSFAASPLHGMTDDYKGGGYQTYLRSTRWLKRAVNAEPVSCQGVYARALYLGRLMAFRDAGFARRGNRAKADDAPDYSLYGANHNSHFLHYAYVADPLRLPAASLPATALYAARCFADAVAFGDAEALVATGTGRELMVALRSVVRWHLSHYPQHRAAVDEAFYTAVWDDALLRRLPEGHGTRPEVAELPR